MRGGVCVVEMKTALRQDPRWTQLAVFSGETGGPAPQSPVRLGLLSSPPQRDKAGPYEREA